MVVKSLGLPEVTQSSLCAELFGNLLARELGVETPAPALVDLTPEFVEAIKPALFPRGIRPQPGLAAACEYFRGGFASAVPDAALTRGELAQAARIYAFDLLVQNPDRRPEKPNCAQRGGRFMAYDFEMAFSFLLVIGQKDEPWEVAKHGLGPKHLFYSSLRAAEIDWEPFLTDLAGLSDDRLDWLEGCMPEAWRPWTARVRRHLVAAKMHLSEFAWELRRSLA
jgi:hypothetical protein